MVQRCKLIIIVLDLPARQLTDYRYCVSPEGEDVEVLVPDEAHSHDDGHAHEEEHGSHSDEETSDSTSEGQNCHFHAGVE